MRAAVKSNAVDTDAAGGLGSATWVDYGDILGTAALGVRDGRTALGAWRSLLTGGSIRHTIVEVEVAIELDRDLEVVDREVRNVAIRATAKARGAGVIRGSDSRDAFGLFTISRWTTTKKCTAYLESTATPPVTLGGREGVGAVPVVEVEAAIAAEGAGREAAPVEAARLISVALIVRVAGALVGRGVKPALGAT